MNGPMHEKIMHNNGKIEPVRQEFRDMFNEFEQLIDKTMPMIQQYYDDCGQP
jgi:hypothetical protein